MLGPDLMASCSTPTCTERCLCCTSRDCSSLSLQGKYDLCTQMTSYHALHGGNLLVLDEPCSRGLVHNWLSIVFLTVTMVISHTKVRETVDHKWTPCGGSSSRNGLEQDKCIAIPLVNERIDVVFTSRILVGKSEERVTVDVERLHIYRSVSLKRLQFNKVTSWPFEHSGLNRKLVLGFVMICKSDECVTVYHKRCAPGGTVSWYVLKSVKLAAAPFVDNWLCRVGTSVIVVGHGKIIFPKSLK